MRSSIYWEIPYYSSSFYWGYSTFYFRLFLLEKRKDTYPKARKRYRFAVLFPAYDEDEVILHSVEDFLRQEYPRDKYDISSYQIT